MTSPKSCDSSTQLSLAVSREREAGANILFRQVGIFVDYLRYRESCSQRVEDVGDGDPHSPDTWLSAAHSRVAVIIE